MSSRSGTDQRFTVPSREPVYSDAPSGANAIDVTAPRWPPSVDGGPGGGASEEESSTSFSAPFSAFVFSAASFSAASFSASFSAFVFSASVSASAASVSRAGCGGGGAGGGAAARLGGPSSSSLSLSIQVLTLGLLNGGTPGWTIPRSVGARSSSRGFAA